MLRHRHLCLLSLVGLLTLQAHAWVPMPDPVLRAWVASHYPGAINGESIDETHAGVLAATEIDLSSVGTIQDLYGIQAFANLYSLNVSNNPINGLYGPIGLYALFAANCGLTGPLQVPYNLSYLNVSNNAITSIDMSWADNLGQINASYNQITGVVWNTWSSSTVQYVNLSHNQLTGFDTPMPMFISQLDISYNLFTTLPWVWGLNYLNASHNLIQTVMLPDAAGSTAPGAADLSYNQITAVGDLYNWGLTSLDLSNNPLGQGIVELPRGLTEFRVRNTQLPCLPWLPQGLNTLQCTGNGFSCLPNLPPSLSLAATNYGFTPTLCTSSAPCYLVPPQVRLRVCLQGAWNEAAHLMRDDLRVAGVLPLTEPYTALGLPPVFNTAPLTVPAARLAVTGNKAIVDWVVVEVREGGMPGTLRQRMPALLQRDGFVVSASGDSLLRLNVARGSYKIAVKHRNHLAGINFASQPFWNAATTIDLMYPGTTQVNSYAFAFNPSGMRMLVQGDANGDRTVKYLGAGNDRDALLQFIGGSAPTTGVGPVYATQDVNMGGVVKYIGGDNDRDLILQAIGGAVPTQTRTQLPVY